MARSERERTIELGGVRLDLDSMRAFDCMDGRDRELELSPTEHRILKTFLEQPDRLLSRGHLMTAIWGEKIVGPRTIDSHVSHVRGKIRRTSLQIESIRGAGYRLSVGSRTPSAFPRP